MRHEHRRGEYQADTGTPGRHFSSKWPCTGPRGPGAGSARGFVLSGTGRGPSRPGPSVLAAELRRQVRGERVTLGGHVDGVGEVALDQPVEALRPLDGARRRRPGRDVVVQVDLE